MMVNGKMILDKENVIIILKYYSKAKIYIYCY